MSDVGGLLSTVVPPAEPVDDVWDLDTADEVWDLFDTIDTEGDGMVTFNDLQTWDKTLTEDEYTIIAGEDGMVEGDELVDFVIEEEAGEEKKKEAEKEDHDHGPKKWNFIRPVMSY